MALENLILGIGRAAGATGTVGDIEQRRADRKATAHEELAANTKMTLGEVQRLHSEKAKLHPGTDDQQIQAIDKRLGELQSHFTDLYHPEKNPGALEHLGGFIKQHLSRQKQPQVPTTPAQAKEKFSFAGSPAIGTSAADTDKLKQITDAYKKTFGTDMPVEKQQAFFNHLYGGSPLEPKPQHVSDYAQGLKRFVESEGGDPDNPTAEQEKAYREQRASSGKTGNSKFSQEAAVYEKQWGKKIADWTPAELSYFNQKQAYDSARSGQSTTTRLEKDENGVIHPVEITSTRGPTSPPVDPHAAPSTPKTAGEAKKRVSGTAPRSSVREGAALSFKAGTPAVNKAKTEYDEAVKLSSVADQVAKHPNDAINQKRLAVALERTSAGRFTTQALDYIIKAGWGNTLEQWANNPSTGALPADVMRQLIDGAHQNLQASKAALDAARGPDTSSAPQSSGKAVSLAAAKRLPSMKGKSDDEIRAAIKAAGHEVGP